jgi:hypothetical protein
MSPVYDMGGNSTISKLCPPCMLEVGVYITFGCTAHRELKAFFMMVAHSSVMLFEFSFWTLQPFKATVYISSPGFRPFSAAQRSTSSSRKLTHWSYNLSSAVSLIYSESIVRFGNMAYCHRFSCFLCA